MPKVLIERPNRTRIRVFTMCDAARIAREVVKDHPDDTPEEVLACIAKGLGFTHISLSRQRAVESSVNLRKSTIISLLKIAKKPLLSVRWSNAKIIAVVAAILKVLDKIETIVDAIDTSPDQEKVDDAIGKGKCGCKDQPKIKEEAPTL